MRTRILVSRLHDHKENPNTWLDIAYLFQVVIGAISLKWENQEVDL